MNEESPKNLKCKCPASGRALIVCIDGTANQFSVKVSSKYVYSNLVLTFDIFRAIFQNSNVVELYSRVVKDDNQLTYYDSGIGTYVKPSQRFSRMWQRLYNAVDMAIAL